jgi:protein TonB
MTQLKFKTDLNGASNRPTLTVIENGKISSIHGFTPFIFPKDNLFNVGLLSSLLLHAICFLALIYAVSAISKNDLAPGLENATVFNVELVGNSLVEQGLESEESLKKQIEQTPVIEEPKPADEVIVVKKKEINKPKPTVKIENNLTTESKSSQSLGDQSGSSINSGGLASLGVPNGQGSRMPNYAELVASKIANSKIYPRRARERGIEGDVLISLTISKDGKVLESDVIQSDSSILSNGVDDIIRSAQPFPVFPDGFNYEQVTLKVPVKFNLQDN